MSRKIDTDAMLQQFIALRHALVHALSDDGTPRCEIKDELGIDGVIITKLLMTQPPELKTYMEVERELNIVKAELAGQKRIALVCSEAVEAAKNEVNEIQMEYNSLQNSYKLLKSENESLRSAVGGKIEVAAKELTSRIRRLEETIGVINGPEADHDG